MPSPAHGLRQLLDTQTVPIPGAFNALCARAIARAGFQACYISGAATSVSAGVPDIGLLSLDHFARTIRESADASGLPILADADTGFGEAEMVRKTVITYHQSGAAALHLEDQVFPKRCGHLEGKKLVPLDHFLEKLHYATKAAKECDMLICARTDARGTDGMDEAVRRAREYARAGAEMIFPEGLTTEPEFQQFAHALRSPKSSEKPPYLLANMTEFGKTPIIPLERFQKMGYACVIYPVTLLRVAMGAVTRALDTLKREGSIQSVLDQMQTRDDLYKLINYNPKDPWEFPARES